MKTKEQELELIIAEAQAQLELLKNANWEGRLSHGGYSVFQSENGFKSWITCSRLLKHSFTTEHRADLFAKKITLFLEMTNFAHVMNEGWVADWENSRQKKCGVKSDSFGVKTDLAFFANNFIFGIAVKDQATAELMLSEFGERLIEIYNLPC